MNFVGELFVTMVVLGFLGYLALFGVILLVELHEWLNGKKPTSQINPEHTSYTQAPQHHYPLPRPVHPAQGPRRYSNTTQSRPYVVGMLPGSTQYPTAAQTAYVNNHGVTNAIIARNNGTAPFNVM